MATAPITWSLTTRSPIPPNADRPLFTAIENLLEGGARRTNTEYVVRIPAARVHELAERARVENVGPKLELWPTWQTRHLSDIPDEHLLVFMVYNAARSIRQFGLPDENLQALLDRYPDKSIGERDKTTGDFVVTIPVFNSARTAAATS